MKNYFLFFAILVLVPSTFADSKFYFEPKVGFGSSGIKHNNGTTTNSESGISSFNVQSVIGAASENGYFGLDMRYDNLMNALTVNSEKQNLNYLSLGIGFGYTMTYVPIRLTFSLDLQQRGWSSSMDSAFESGGYRFGIGYYISEKMLVNFDYSEPYSKNENSGVAYLPKIYSLNISFPMDFSTPDTPWRERRGYNNNAASPEAVGTPAPPTEVNIDDFEVTNEPAAEPDAVAPTQPAATEPELDLEPMPDPAAPANQQADELNLDDQPAVSEAPEPPVDGSGEEMLDEGGGEALPEGDEFDF